MVVQPILSDSVASFGEIKLKAVMNDAYYNVKTSENDGAHIHSYHEIYVNFSGDISFFHENTVYDIRPLDIIVSYPGDVHYCIYRSSCNHGHYCVWFASETVGKYLERRAIRGRIRLSQKDADKIPKLLQRLSDTECDPFLRASAFSGFLSLLDTESASELEMSDDFPEPLNEMLQYIDENLATISGWSELSREFFISKASINRMFKKHVGISVGKLIEAKRLSYAEKLLRSEVSVTDACYRSGFSDCSRFIASFKKKFGKTPLKYRQEHSDQKLRG